jgi:hypothetical protein
MSYSKEAYAIDLNSLIPELNKIINSQPLSPNLQIPKEEYFDRISFSGKPLTGNPAQKIIYRTVVI